jgi:beta-glucosidase
VSTHFPASFTWGVAAASYQVEGAVAADGRGPSIWDVFSRKPGAVWSGHTGEGACDHYHRYAEDVRLMAELGVRAYRLSIAWPRVFPEGTGRVNTAGLDFYDRLLDALLGAGIEPWLTLYHWDLPQALQDRGGWLNPESPRWFADYAELIAARYSDRVRHFITLNEPQVFIGLGLWEGKHAPGHKLSWAEVLRAGHHALLAHGLGVRALRARAKQPCSVGIAPAVQVYLPRDPESARDIEAARRRTAAVVDQNTWNNAWWLDPLKFGRYPEDALALWKQDAPHISAADAELLTTPFDFVGCNIYMGWPVRARDDGSAERVEHPVGHPRTAFDWPVNGEALYWGPRFLHERYGWPIVITENGVSCRDWIAKNGTVPDPLRVDYLRRHLLELHRALTEGVPVLGYFQWSILDNFEWAEGYKERFGLVYVDYPSQRRVPKDSAYWYRDVIRSCGARLAED